MTPRERAEALRTELAIGHCRPEMALDVITAHLEAAMRAAMVPDIPGDEQTRRDAEAYRSLRARMADDETASLLPGVSPWIDHLKSRAIIAEHNLAGLMDQGELRQRADAAEAALQKERLDHIATLGQFQDQSELRQRVAELEAALRSSREIVRSAALEHEDEGVRYARRLALNDIDAALAAPSGRAPMKWCTHGVDHSGERHGCDGCCPRSPRYRGDTLDSHIKEPK